MSSGTGSINPSSDKGGFVPPSTGDLDAILDQYEFLDLLGRGGMGAVYKARQKSLDRLVAIKILPPQLATDEEENGFRFSERFQREAKAMAKLSHPHIVAVYDFGQAKDGQFYFVMEYIEGTDLAALIKGGQMTTAHVTGWMSQICDALQYAHNKGIVHRDIKPANIMITREGQVKVADFGLAKLSGGDAAAQTKLTMTNMAMGTPDYVAPEALEMDVEVDHRADLYALGVMLYEMLTGKVPRGAWRPPSTQIAGLDPRYDELIDRAMDADRESRFQQASEISATIYQIVTTPAKPAAPASGGRRTMIAGNAAGTSPVKSAATPPQDRTRPQSPTGKGKAASTAAAAAAAAAPPEKPKNPVVIIAALAAGAIAVGLGVFFLFGPGFGPSPGPNPVAENVPAESGPAPPSPSEVKKPAPPPVNPPINPPAQSPVSTVGLPGGKVEPHPANATKNAPFVNSLGMKFAPVPITGGPTNGKNVLFSIWETRRSDYQRFVSATKRPWQPHDWQMAGFVETTDHPAVAVNWEDATEFCVWLTKQERDSGKIEKDAVYRLPKDHEWSCAVGIGDKEDPSASPTEKSGGIEGYFWGIVWPPPQGVENFYGEESQSVPYGNVAPLPGYRDPFPRTAPVGSFKPNELGLYDLGGNVHEWCEEKGGAASAGERRVLRGGTWWQKYDERDYFLRSKRTYHSRTAKFGFNGFRVVLELPASGEAALALAPKQTIDLLALTDPVKDRVQISVPALAGANNWSRGPGGSLIYTSDGKIGKLMPPVALDARTYEFEIAFKRKDGTGELHLDLPLDAAPTAVPLILDLAGTRFIEHKAGTAWPAGLPPGGRVVVRCESATKGESRVTITFDGRIIGDWTGSLRDYGNNKVEPHPSFPGEMIASIFSRRDSYEFTKWELRVFEGEARVLRGEKPPSVDLTFNGHRYEYFSEKLSWTEAKAKAESLGGHLAAITTKEEHEWVVKQFGDRLTANHQGLWLGGWTDDSAGKWHWVTGEPFSFTAWGTGEPNGLKGGTQGEAPYYVNLFRADSYASGFGWNDSSLTDAFWKKQNVGFLVEWDNLSSNPATLTGTATPANATKDAPFTNALGMKFVPVPITGGPTDGQRILFSVWETRVQDYEPFIAETQRPWSVPKFPQGPTHPAVGVGWENAEAYCQWLTERERKAARLGPEEVYRLPSDHEWSCAVGIADREDPAALPQEKSGRIADHYPWGTAWPPPPGAGNFSGEEAAGNLVSTTQQILTGYRDEFPATAPVGSFPPDRWGLHDMAGNALEFCGDWHDKAQKSRPRRGGAFDESKPAQLLSSSRLGCDPVARGIRDGFRVVLQTATLPAPPNQPAVVAVVATPADPRVAQLEAGFKARLETDAEKPYLDAVATLNQSYVANGIARARAAAQQTGKLDEVTALDAEKARVEKGEPLPAADLDTLPAALKTLRTTYRTALAKHTADRAAKAAPIYDLYLGALDAYIAELTKANQIEKASRIKTHRDAIAAQKAALLGDSAALTPPPPVGAVPVPTPAKPEPTKAPVFNPGPALPIPPEALAPPQKGKYRVELLAWLKKRSKASVGIIQGNTRTRIQLSSGLMPNGSPIPSGADLWYIDNSTHGGRDADFDPIWLEGQTDLEELSLVFLNQFSGPLGLRGMKKLEYLKISGFVKALPDEQMLLWPPLPALKEASIQGSFGNVGLRVLSERCPQLTSLTLEGCGLTEGGLLPLRQLSHLTSLYLNFGTCPASEWPVLGTLPKLEKLSLGHLDLTNADFSSLINLTSLNVYSCQFGDNEARTLGTLKNLTRLYFDANQITDGSLSAIGALPKLQELNIINSPINGSTLASLSGLKNLTVLQFIRTRISDDTLAGLPALPALIRLWLESHSAIGDGAAESIVRQRNLAELNLSSTAITDVGVQAICNQLTGLDTLWLNGTKITDAGIPALKRLKVISRLELRSTAITDASVPVLKDLSTLRNLLVPTGRLSPAALAELKKALPNCQVTEG